MIRRLHCLPVLLALLLATPAVQAQPAKPHDPKLDEKTATELRKRFEQGDGGAAGVIGNMLGQKRIAETRHGMALDWYRKGCALRDMPSCHNIALAYQEGTRGLKRDPAEAARYYELAANRGFLNSMFNLAILYADHGLTSSVPGEGLKWMLVAQRSATQCPERPLCRLVLKDDKGYVKRLESGLSSRELREAYRLAETWQPSGPPAEPRRLQ